LTEFLNLLACRGVWYGWFGLCQTVLGQGQRFIRIAVGLFESSNHHVVIM
jgi:hypothetical protein